MNLFDICYKYHRIIIENRQDIVTPFLDNMEVFKNI